MNVHYVGCNSDPITPNTKTHAKRGGRVFRHVHTMTEEQAMGDPSKLTLKVSVQEWPTSFFHSHFIGQIKSHGLS